MVSVDGKTANGVTADDVICSIEMILGRTPDESLVQHHLGMGFTDRFALGEYMLSTQEFVNRRRGESTPPLFLGDRLMARTHRGEIIYVLPTDLDLTPSMIRDGVHEPAVERVIIGSIEAGHVAVDLGANVGYHTLAIAAATGAAGTVHVFEANPVVARLLLATLLVNGCTDFRGTGRVSLHNKAVADRPGTLTLEAAPDHYGSGHIVIADRPASDFGESYSSRVEIESVVLDDILRDVPAVDFLHMDIEGAEVLALAGAVKLIDRSPALRIVTEWSVGMMRSLGDPEAVIRLLTDRGFHFWRVVGQGTLEAVPTASLIGLPHCDLFISRQEPPRF